MSRRQAQHGGANAGPQATNGQDAGVMPGTRAEALAQADYAREISRKIDRNEGFDRRDHRDPHSGASTGRKTKNGRAGRRGSSR